MQQYLIPFPGGRLQALGFAWDARPLAQGGQRWFALYPDPAPRPGNPLHWTGRDQTWNYMCAECHSTNLRKGFDLAANSYATTWTDVDVACEACHGPGSTHVAWAQARSGADPQAFRRATPPDDHMGLVAWLRSPEPVAWEMDPQSGIARRSGAPPSDAQLNACAGCHSRRRPIAAGESPDQPFLDRYLPALLDPGLYHADGQIDGEVFEWGSFVQSPMFRAGVTCTNCHEPHSARLRADGNDLCAQCHLPAKFDTASHHHHPDGAGVLCVSCHMATKVYMGVDARRDHSFRIPRPDRSVTMGTPNACAPCHADHDAAWAAQAVAQWYPNGRQARTDFANALHAARGETTDAASLLDRLVHDPSQPAIARATALPLLSRLAGPGASATLQTALADTDPLVRLAAARALPEPLPLSLLEAMLPLASDPVRAVRLEAARALAGVDPQGLPSETRLVRDRAVADLIASELLDADRPETHLNLGLLQMRLRQADAAEAAWRTSLRLDPGFVPAMVNLADLERMRGHGAESVMLLRQAVATEPGNADATHALGLAMIRQRSYPEAVALLKAAHALAPGNARYAYVYAVALNSTGRPEQADEVLRETHARHPADRDVLVALISSAQARGDAAAALRYGRELAQLSPTDPQVREFVRRLEQSGRPSAK